MTQYPRSMDTVNTTAAVQRGIRRGIQMAMSPDSEHLRELAQEASQRDLLQESWIQVGTNLASVMRTSTAR